MVKTVEDIMRTDQNTVLILGDIGVHAFKNTFASIPERIFNIGILEQATIGTAAGLSMTGLIPIVHTIATFLTERSYEQLKLDFGYQKLGGNFISIGASYDYAALGCTHHCPADIQILKQIPGMEILVPGTPKEFDTLFRQTYDNGRPTYYRLSERSNKNDQTVTFGKANVIKKGRLATIVVVGPLLDKAVEASKNLDVTILYYTTISPFDFKTLKNNCPSGKILLCEPYYSGALATDIITALSPKPIRLEFVGVPKTFLTNYGTAEQHDESLKLTPDGIRAEIKKLIHE